MLIVTSSSAETNRQPSIQRTVRGHEAKLIASTRHVEAILSAMRASLPPDPFAAAFGGDTYAVHTLYFDTEQLDVARGGSGGVDPKYRVRRYGHDSNLEPLLFLERKSRHAFQVRKHRTVIPAEELDFLSDSRPPDGWPGRWFRKRLRARGLQPACQVSYLRAARVGIVGGQEVRVTLDRGMRWGKAEEFVPPDPEFASAPLLRDSAVVEVKFEDAMPSAFRELFCDLGIAQAAFSKYRLAMTQFGRVQPE